MLKIPVVVGYSAWPFHPADSHQQNPSHWPAAECTKNRSIQTMTRCLVAQLVYYQTSTCNKPLKNYKIIHLRGIFLIKILWNNEIIRKMMHYLQFKPLTLHTILPKVFAHPSNLWEFVGVPITSWHVLVINLFST